MNQFETTRTDSATKQVDAGLRKHMNNIYAKMTAGVLVTAITALVISSSDLLLKLFLGGPQAFAFALAPAAVMWFGFRPEKHSASKLQLAFFVISVLYGISFASISYLATNDPAYASSVAKAFFIVTSMFAGLSIFGYTTKKDLSGFRTFLVMGIMGLFGFSIINMFFQNDMMTNIIAFAGIPLFAGLTVWQTQDMKRMYSANLPPEMAQRYGWAAALNLYVSFIAMFQYILHFLNQR